MAIRVMEVGRRRPFIERGYREGGRYQWVRETAMNAIEARATRIEFSIEWQGVRNRHVYRRMIADDGMGMTAEEMESYLNKFGGGGKDIGGAHDNFGIGAKTALLPWNPYGVVVISYRDGAAAMVWLQYDAVTDEYGLRLFDAVDEDGSDCLGAAVQPFYDEEHDIDWATVKPDWISDHGTVFVLMGRRPDEDTLFGDRERGETGIKDISRYLNHRLWELPGVSVAVEEFASNEKADWPTTRARTEGFSQFREIRGARHYIMTPISRAKKDDRQVKQGVVKMRDRETEIEWYLLRGEKSKIWSFAPATGFIAVKYKGELHNITDHPSVYRNFGVVESQVRSNLWIIITPPLLDGKRGVYQKSDRNELAWAGGEPLPINDWGVEFAENMPAEVLRAIQEARGTVIGRLPNEAWRDRMAQRFAERFKIMRKLRDTDGVEIAGDVAVRPKIVVPPTPPPPPPPVPSDREPVPPRPSRPKRPVLNTFGNPNQARKGKAKGAIPDWTTTHNPNDIETGMIAAYTTPSVAAPYGLVTIFGDHPILRQLITYWQDRYPVHQASEIRKEIEDIYGMVAAFKIAHSEHLAGLVDRKIIEEMRSPKALTVALLGIAAEEALIEKRMKKFGRSKKGVPLAA